MSSGVLSAVEVPVRGRCARGMAAAALQLARTAQFAFFDSAPATLYAPHPHHAYTPLLTHSQSHSTAPTRQLSGCASAHVEGASEGRWTVRAMKQRPSSRSS